MMRYRYRKGGLLILLTLMSLEVNGHGSLEPVFGFESSLMGELRYQTDGVETDPWQISGALMGGEAYGVEEGVSLQGAALTAEYGSEDEWFVSSEVGAHSHGDAYEIDIEEAYGGQYIELDDVDLRLDAGMFKGMFSPENGRHVSDSIYHDVPLMYSVLLGGHYSDIGARALAKNEQWLFGAEIWRGDAFPGRDGKNPPSFDLFAYYDSSFMLPNAQPVHINVGAWYMQLEAEDRNNDRFHQGHSHDAGDTVRQITFSGEHELIGLHLDARYQFQTELSVMMTGQYAVSRSKGKLEDPIRRADIRARYESAWYDIQLAWTTHRLGVRYDWLGLDNHLRGAGAELLARDANLVREENDPYRVSLSYAYAPNGSLMLKTGLSLNQGLEEEDVAFIGLRWIKKLYK